MRSWEMTKTTDAFNSFCDIVKTLNIEQNKNIFSDASDEKYQVVKSTKNAKRTQYNMDKILP